MLCLTRDTAPPVSQCPKAKPNLSSVFISLVLILNKVDYVANQIFSIFLLGFLFVCLFVLLLLFCVCLFFVFCFPIYSHKSTWKFPGQRSNQSCSCWPTPQPEQHQIWATSVTYAAIWSNTGSLTHWARPGIEPTSSQRKHQSGPYPLFLVLHSFFFFFSFFLAVPTAYGNS